MNPKEQIDHIFNDFLKGEIPKIEIEEFAHSFSHESAKELMLKVETLTHPSKYFEKGTENIEVLGFFLFIDLACALMVLNKEAAQDILPSYASSSKKYTRWVLKNVKDERFQAEVSEKFSFLLP